MREHLCPEFKSPHCEKERKDEKGKEKRRQPGVVVHACEPSTQEAEIEGSLRVQGQPEL